MSIAVQTALAGLITASQRLEQGAERIASGSGQPMTQAAQSARSVAGARIENPAPGATGAAAETGAPSLTDGLFAMQQAEIQYKASAKLLGALNDIQKETLDILG